MIRALSRNSTKMENKRLASIYYELENYHAKHAELLKLGMR